MDEGDLGLLNRMFEAGRQYEVVGTTLGDRGKGKANAAALGVTWDGESFGLRVFKGSDTFRNLRGLRRLGINVVSMDEVHLIARSALVGWDTDEDEFEEDDYVHNRGFPFLKEASAHIDCTVDDWTENYGQDDIGSYHVAIFKAVPERARVMKDGVMPVERSGNPIIEAMVMVTRWQVTEGRTREYLREKVEGLLDMARSDPKDSICKAVEVVEGFLERNES